MSRLRALDDRVVPLAAARLRALVDTFTARPGRLRRLDDRYAGRGPLAVVRSAPALGVAVVLAVLLAGVGVVLARDGSAGGQGAPVRRVLGPDPGTRVADYVARARAQAAAYSQDRPQAQHEALVSLSRYATPAQARGLLEGLAVQRAYLRVPSSRAGGSELLAAPVVDLLPDLTALCARTAERKRQDATEHAAQARSVTGTSDQERQQRAYEAAVSTTARAEATAYGSGCACVFSAVVRGPAGLLAALPALRGVRVVDLAPGGVPLDQLEVRPLSPEQVTVATSLADVHPGPVPSPAGAPGPTPGG